MLKRLFTRLWNWYFCIDPPEHKPWQRCTVADCETIEVPAIKVQHARRLQRHEFW